MTFKVPVQPSRILNDQRGFFGLTLSDFAAGFAVFTGISLVLDGTGWALISIPAAIIALVMLVPLRLATRRHIVRDALGFLVSPKVVYDPRK